MNQAIKLCSFKKNGKKETKPGIINSKLNHVIFEHTPFTLKIKNNRIVHASIRSDIKSDANMLLQMICPIKNGWRNITL